MADQSDKIVADTQEMQMTNEEVLALAFIQQAWAASHDWDVVLQKVKEKYSVPYIACIYSVMEFCAARGYLQVIQWMRSPELPGGPCHWDHWCCARAAKHGDLHVLQWLRNPVFPSGTLSEMPGNAPESPSEPCPWDSVACTWAAGRGHLQVLQWLRNPVSPSGMPLPGGPCPWDVQACYYAGMNGHLEVLEYLYEAEAPFKLPNNVHENCKEFVEIYRESWESRTFDVPLPWQCMKPAKN